MLCVLFEDATAAVHHGMGVHRLYAADQPEDEPALDRPEEGPALRLDGLVDGAKLMLFLEGLGYLLVDRNVGPIQFFT